MVKYVRHDPFLVSLVQISDHCVGLSAASLAIGKNCPVVAFERVFDDLEGGRGVHLLLLTRLVKDFVEAKSLVVTIVVRSTHLCITFGLPR